MDIKNSAFVERETTQLADDLAKHADQPVAIELVGGGHRKTSFGSDLSKVKITLNPVILERVRNEDTARTLWRALGFYQLQQELSPCEEQLKKADREGFRAVFRLLNDESNERQAMAKDSSLGSLFQSLTAHVYRAGERKRSDAVTAVGGDQGNAPLQGDEAYTARVNEFAYHVRRHLPPREDTAPQVAAALALVPQELKDASKDELLKLARQIHEVLCRDLALPSPLLVQAVKPMQAPPANDPDNGNKEEDDPLLNLSPVDPRWWQAVLRSRLAWTVLGTSVFLWLVLFFSLGLNFWVALFFVVGSATILGGLCYLWWRRGGKRADESEGERFDWEAMWQRLFGWMPFRIRFQSWGIGEALANCWQGFVRKVLRPFGQRCSELWASFSEFAGRVWRSPLVSHVREGIVTLAAGFYRWLIRTAILAWHSRWFRLVLVGMPIAAVFVTACAVAVFGAELLLWQLICLILFVVGFLSVGWLFREKLRNFLIVGVLSDEDLEHDVATRLHKEKSVTTYQPIKTVVPIDADPLFLNATVAEVSIAAQVLSESLNRIGFVSSDRDNRPEGFDVIDELEQVLLGETDILVDDEQKPRASLALDVLVDCSDSQGEETTRLRKGEKMALSKKMALAVEAAVKGRRAVSVHLWGFTGSEIYDCGPAGQGRVSGLKCGGGNNDAAALKHAAQSATARGKSVSAVILISDAEPADCSWGALHALGWELVRQGVVVIPVIVGPQDGDPPLPWNIVNLHDKPLVEAAFDLGRVLEAQLGSVRD